MDDPHGPTRIGPLVTPPLQGGGGAPPAASDDYHLQEVRRAVGADYDVYGEICDVGDGTKSGVAYLARRSGSMRLDALRLMSTGDSVEVLGRMGEALPSGADLCPKCNSPIRAGVRFCGNCRANLSAFRLTDAPDSMTIPEWLELKSESGRHNYEVIGQLVTKQTRGALAVPNAQDGTTLLVAKTSNTSRIVALRLERGVAGSPSVVSLDQTQALSGLVASLIEGPNEPYVAPVAVAPAPREDIPPLPIAPIAPPPVAPAALTPTPPWTPVTPGAPGTPPWVRMAIVALSGAAVIAAIAWLVSAMSNKKSPADDTLARTDSVQQDTVRPDTARAVVDSATVQINPSLPTGASVMVDRAPVSGRVIRLAPGTHTLTATARGFKPATQTVDVRPGQRLTWPTRVEAEAKIDTVAVAPPRPASGCVDAARRSDWAQALALCSREAGSNNSAFAERTLGIMHERGLGVGQDLPVAGEWYSASARHGDAEGQYLYGRMLQDGRGVRANVAEAAQWYTKSAEQGNADAQYALGMLYTRGDGVPKSDADAIKWLQRAAAKGNDRARQELSRRGVRP